ncbi:hypothetical protein PUN28_016059 [Cardiocondyla obscurior]|uniref:Uncharacterized protein n=1 Tax=Cardiocondyla obscurior TaxID=286306 RepID=A0AAW2ERV9_9HYME
MRSGGSRCVSTLAHSSAVTHRDYPQRSMIHDPGGGGGRHQQSRGVCEPRNTKSSIVLIASRRRRWGSNSISFKQ